MIFIVIIGAMIAMAARSAFHGLLAMGVTLLLGLQTFVIIGGVFKLIPLTGVTLPLIAEGGSSLAGYMAAIGLLLGVSSLNDDADEQDRRRAEWREDGQA